MPRCILKHSHAERERERERERETDRQTDRDRAVFFSFVFSFFFAGWEHEPRPLGPKETGGLSVSPGKAYTLLTDNLKSLWLEPTQEKYQIKLNHPYI